MDIEKKFLITPRGRSETTVTVSPELGRILMRPEVDGIVGTFGSKVVRSLGFTSIDIVPPIPDDQLPALGENLTQLCRDLDPTTPYPTYEIK